MGEGTKPSQVEQTLAALASLLKREHVLGPEEAMELGYAPIEDIARALHVSASAARGAMKRLEQQGKVERCSVKSGRSIASYWRVKD
ncbi:MAG: FaeA/PapI family transcriptional regulator [Candidatus Bilamarchaeaceae archaeon]